MKWILIVIYFGAGALKTIAIQDFNTEQACKIIEYKIQQTPGNKFYTECSMVVDKVK